VIYTTIPKLATNYGEYISRQQLGLMNEQEKNTDNDSKVHIFMIARK